MAYLSKDDIFRADDILTSDVEVPEWGGTVRIKAWTVAQGDMYGEKLAKHHKDETFMSQFREFMVAQSVIDENGKLMFCTADIVKLGQKSPAALKRIVLAVQELNKLQNGALEKGDEAEAEASEDAENESPNA